MKAELLETIKKDTDGWEYLQSLPEELQGFKLAILQHEAGDSYELFSYTDQVHHRGAVAYYHQETREYKFRIYVGLTGFCLYKFFTDKLDVYESHLKKYLEQTIHDLGHYNPDTFSYIMREQNITDWNYKPFLPDTLEGFKLFIRPDEPFRVLNGSYIIFDYTDFSIESNFIIYYNEFRSEFYGEARIKNIPEMNYVFDSRDIPELEDKLQANMVDRLREIRRRASE